MLVMLVLFCIIYAYNNNLDSQLKHMSDSLSVITKAGRLYGCPEFIDQSISGTLATNNAIFGYNQGLKVNGIDCICGMTGVDRKRVNVVIELLIHNCESEHETKAKTHRDT